MKANEGQHGMKSVGREQTQSQESCSHIALMQPQSPKETHEGGLFRGQKKSESQANGSLSHGPCPSSSSFGLQVLRFPKLGLKVKGRRSSALKVRKTTVMHT